MTVAIEPGWTGRANPSKMHFHAIALSGAFRHKPRRDIIRNGFVSQNSQRQ